MTLTDNPSDYDAPEEPVSRLKDGDLVKVFACIDDAASG